MIRRLIILLLIVGCGTEPEENSHLHISDGVCVKVSSSGYTCYSNHLVGGNVQWTEKDCVEKDLEFSHDDSILYKWFTMTCHDFCSLDTSNPSWECNISSLLP